MRLWHAIREVWNSLRYGVMIDGHDFGEPTYIVEGDKEWEVLTCRCGAESRAWRPM